MPLEETVESLDGISEEYQDLYVEQEDGKFKIDISGLKSAVQKERNLRKKAEKAKANVDDIPDLAEITVKLDEANATIKDMKMGTQMKTAALAAGVHPDYLDDVITLTKGNFGLDDKGNVVHLDTDGEPSGMDAGKYFNNSFKKAKPIYFTSSGKQGGGAQQNTDGALTATGRIKKAIETKDTRSYINETMSKVKKI